MRIRVTQTYTTQYPDPIRFAAGETVIVEKCDPDNPVWFWCRVESGKIGWVHHSFLAATEGETTAIKDYSARELTVAEGEKGEVLNELGGWHYIRLDDGNEGWVPTNHTGPL